MDITIPDSKKEYNSQFKKLLNECMCNYEQIETKDGVVYTIEFKSTSIRDKFLDDLSLKYPFH